MQKNIRDEQPQAGVSPTSSLALCVEQMWVSLGALSLAPTPSLTTPVRPYGVQGMLLTSPSSSSSSSHPCLSQLLILSSLFAPSLSSLCVQNSTKALRAPRAVTQTVKNVYVLVAFHFCVLILHTQAHALTHGVPGASTGCWPREPGQSKGIWALLEKAGKEERKIQKQKRVWRQAAPPARAAAPALDGGRQSCMMGVCQAVLVPAIPLCPLSPTQHSLWDWGR